VSWRIFGAVGAWLLRAAELPIAIGLTVLTSPGPLGPAVVILMAVTAAAWLAWLVVQPWTTDVPARGPVVPALLTVIAASAGLVAVAPTTTGWMGLPMVVACLSAATSLRRHALLVPVTGVAAVTVGWLLTRGSLSGAIILVALDAAFFVSGLARGLRQAQLREERAGAADRARAAALAERTRIAREIHDILAHSLADLSIQLELADALLTDGGDTTGARDRVRHAHRLAADGLVETRRAVHALRSDAPPLPDALAALAGARDATFEVSGAPRPLPAAAGLALLRTAQEALVNAAKHAPGTPVAVSLRYEPQCTGLTISNAAAPLPTPAGPAGGYGLAGMSERLRLAGGSLTAGMHPGGWTVHAEVPATAPSDAQPHGHGWQALP